MTGSKTFLLQASNATHIGPESNNSAMSVLDLSQVAYWCSFISQEFQSFAQLGNVSVLKTVACLLSSCRTKNIVSFCQLLQYSEWKHKDQFNPRKITYNCKIYKDF